MLFGNYEILVLVYQMIQYLSAIIGKGNFQADAGHSPMFLRSKWFII